MPGGEAWELPAPRSPGPALSSGESPRRGCRFLFFLPGLAGRQAQCLLKVEPDTLWNVQRLVGDVPGAATAPQRGCIYGAPAARDLGGPGKVDMSSCGLVSRWRKTEQGQRTR